MLGGELVDTELLDVLTELSDAAVTGCLHVSAPARGTARLYLRAGSLAASTPAGAGPASPADLVQDLLHWADGSWRLRLHERPPSPPRGPAVPVDELLAGLTAGLPAPADVPRPVPGPELPADGDARRLLQRADGRRTVAELARTCGLTVYAAARLLAALEQAGAVTVEPAPRGTPVRVVPEVAVGAELAEVHAAVALVVDALTELVGPSRDLPDAFRRPVLTPATLPAVSGPDRETHDAERAEQERAEQERAEQERAQQERAEHARAEHERADAERVQQERAAAARAEHERAEQERAAAAPAIADPVEADRSEPARPDAASLAAFASELTATANSAPSAVPPRPAEPEPVVPQAAAAQEAMRTAEDEPQARPDTDTAALLRELASLGLEDGPTAAPAPRTPAPPAPSAAALAQARKKKGLFGR